jgi:hypothetical protein
MKSVTHKTVHKHRGIMLHAIHTVATHVIVLKLGPVWLVDPGPDWPKHGTDLDLKKTRLRVGLVKSGRPGRSIRDPADPGKPEWRPTSFFLYMYKGHATFWLKDQNNEMNDALIHWCRIAAIARVIIADADTTVSQLGIII